MNKNGCYKIFRPMDERGVVLAAVLLFSAVALIIMTALMYMITSGTMVSGMQKRYASAVEAGVGGTDIVFKAIATRAATADLASLRATYNSFGFNFASTTPSVCTGVTDSTYTGLAAKLMTPSSAWTNCDSSHVINPADNTTFDMKMELGTTNKYAVYAKIIAATEGNTGGEAEGADALNTSGVTGSGSGEVAVMPIPYLYAIEVEAESVAKKGERAKFSVLYQY